MTARDDRFLDPDELAERYGDVLHNRNRNTIELDTEEWEAAHSRAEHSE